MDAATSANATRQPDGTTPVDAERQADATSPLDGPGGEPRRDPHDPKPDVVVGWILAADVRETATLQAYADAREALRETMQRQFPGFAWRMPQVEKRSFPPRGSLQPLPLVELAGEEKLRRGWDYAIVVVPNELEPRRRLSMIGVPSSALEVAVASSSRLGSPDVMPQRLAGLAQHLLGRLLTLQPRNDGPMAPPLPETVAPGDFAADQIEQIERELEEITDPRLEEERRTWNPFAFYLRVLADDPWGIAANVLADRPWRMPLYLGRLSATVAAGLLILMLTAEAWEIGAAIGWPMQISLAVISIALATAFIFFGQHLDRVGRGRGWSEQLARSRIVLTSTLLAAMISLWLVLLLVVFAASWMFPIEVAAGWAGFAADEFPRLRFVVFLASVGILAAALGGNLEEEGAIRAELFFDEEV